MDKIDVSIIIPVYNVEPYITECLQSVMAQTASCNMECLVVDDCGTDSSMLIARNLIDDYRGPIDFKIVTRENNGGLSAARNSGIRAAKGDYIYLLDSDDIITPDCIESLMIRAKEYPSAQIITGDFQTFPQKDVHKWFSLQGKTFPDFSDDIKWIRSFFLSKLSIMVWNKLIRRSFIIDNKLNFKEGIIHEDNHWQAQAYHHIQYLAFVNKVTYLYRIREGSITSNPNAIPRALDNLFIIYHEIFSKHVKWDKPWSDWITACLAEFKFSLRFKEIRPQALVKFKTLTKVIKNNSMAPLPMRMLFAYWGIKSHYGQDRLFFALHYRYWKLLQKFQN